MSIKIKKVLSESNATKWLYNFLKTKYHNHRKNEGMNVFKDKGIETLFYTQDVFHNSGYDFFFFLGTCLGIFRDGKLLNRDMDLDVLVFIEEDANIIEFREYLISNGFSRLHSYIMEDEGYVQDAFLYNKIMVDINYVRKYKDLNCYYLFFDESYNHNVALLFPFSADHSSKFLFRDKLINLPSNPEEFLRETYGDDWKVPNPHYKYWDNPNAIKTNRFGTVETIKIFDYC